MGSGLQFAIIRNSNRGQIAIGVRPDVAEAGNRNVLT